MWYILWSCNNQPNNHYLLVLCATLFGNDDAATSFPQFMLHAIIITYSSSSVALYVCTYNKKAFFLNVDPESCLESNLQLMRWMKEA